MDFAIPEELKQLQMLARDFIKKELLPLEKQVEETGELPEAVRQPLKKKAVANGLWNYAMPAEHGGGGVGMLGVALVNMELGHVSGCMARGVIGGPRSGNPLGFRFATPYQLENYFIPLVNGERESYFAVSEANAGSDIGNVETRAARDGANYILNGSKLYVTGIDVADFGIVLAVTDWQKRRKGGLTCFLVDTNTPGLTLSRHLPMMGRRGLNSYEVSLENCAVPARNVLGEPGKGLEVLADDLNLLRISGSSASLGTAERAVEMARAHARERVTFGEPLSRRQLVQEMIVRAEIDIFASKMMIFNAAWEADQGLDITQKTMMIKCFVTEMAIRVVDRAIQVHGGLGYSKDLPLEMMYRDVRLRTLTEGPTEVLEWTLARNLLK